MNWVRSSRCHSSSCCVEVAQVDGQVHIRSSLWPATTVLTLDEWDAFVEGVKAGDFEELPMNDD